MSFKVEGLKEFVEEYKEQHPVLQSVTKGAWGFERVNDCLNLNRCVYATKRSAQIARHKEAKNIFEYNRAMSAYYGGENENFNVEWETIE